MLDPYVCLLYNRPITKLIGLRLDGKRAWPRGQRPWSWCTCKALSSTKSTACLWTGRTGRVLRGWPQWARSDSANSWWTSWRSSSGSSPHRWGPTRGPRLLCDEPVLEGWLRTQPCKIFPPDCFPVSSPSTVRRERERERTFRCECKSFVMRPEDVNFRQFSTTTCCFAKARRRVESNCLPPQTTLWLYLASESP